MRCQLGAGIVYFARAWAFAFRNANSSVTMSRSTSSRRVTKGSSGRQPRGVGRLARARLPEVAPAGVRIEELEAAHGRPEERVVDDRDQRDPPVAPVLPVGDRLDPGALLECDRLENRPVLRRTQFTGVDRSGDRGPPSPPGDTPVAAGFPRRPLSPSSSSPSAPPPDAGLCATEPIRSRSRCGTSKAESPSSPEVAAESGSAWPRPSSPPG